MLIVLVSFACAAIAWSFMRDLGRRPGVAGERDHALRRAMEALAAEGGLQIEEADPAKAPVLRGRLHGVDFRLEPGTRGPLFDGDVTLVAAYPTDGRLVVWPRDPPDEVVEGLGEERPTNNAAFDARFAVHGTPAEIALLRDDPEIGPSLYELGIVALLIDRHEASLLLPGVPDRDALAQAVALLREVVSGTS